MVEDLHIYTFLASALHWPVKSGIRQAYWLEIINIKLCAKHYQNIPNASRVQANYANCPQTVYKLSTNGLVDSRVLFKSRSYNLSTFLRVIQFGLICSIIRTCLFVNLFMSSVQ